MSNIPAELKYTKEHEWIKLDGNTAIIGITDYAQGELGDIVFVELPAEGDELTIHTSVGTIEAVKAVSDMFAPISGKVVEVNAALEDDPMVINRDPYGEGWMLKIEMSSTDEAEQLLDSNGYDQVVGQS